MKHEELIWVSREFADKWKELTSKEETRGQQEAVFNEYMKTVSDKIKEDFRCSLESLEEDSIVFTGLMLKVRQAFEKAKNEHLTASYDLWEKFEAEIPSIQGKVAKIVDVLKPLKDELDRINALLGSINTFQIENLNQAISLFASNYSTNKEMIDFLVTNFKRERHK